MNGRIQDAVTGVFILADASLPDPANTLSYNRYSYVNNNPLTMSDPSGFLPCNGDDSTCTDPNEQLSDVGCGFGGFGPCFVNQKPMLVALPLDIYPFFGAPIFGGSFKFNPVSTVQKPNPFKSFLCADSPDDSGQGALDYAADMGTLADTIKAAVGIGAVATGVGTAYPRAMQFIG